MKNFTLLILIAVIFSCNNNPTQNNPINTDKLQLSFTVELRDSMTNNLIQTVLDTTFSVDASFIANPSSYDSGSVAWWYPTQRNAITITSKITNNTSATVDYQVGMQTNRPSLTVDEVIVKPNESVDTIRYGFGHYSMGYVSVWQYFTPGSLYVIKYIASKN